MTSQLPPHPPQGNPASQPLPGSPLPVAPSGATWQQPPGAYPYLGQPAATAAAIPSPPIPPFAVEPSGSKSVIGVCLAILIFCVPIGVMSAIGNAVGPLLIEHKADAPIEIEGKSHVITFNLPMDCSENIEDPSMADFSCVDDNHEVNLIVRPVEEINNIELSAKRAAREATLNRLALDFPVDTVDIPNGKAAHVTSGGLFGTYSESLAIMPEGQISGFIINISEQIPESDDEPITKEIVQNLIKNISIEALNDEEGK